jgi:OmpA-OmpF porin, OOP family
MKRSACLSLLLCMSGTAMAALDAPPNYVGVMGSYVFTDSVRGTDDGAGWHILYGSPMNRLLSLELNAFGHRAQLENADDYEYAYGAGLDLRYLLGEPARGLFMLGGLGSIWEDLVGEEQLSPYLNLGVGVQFGSHALQMRAEGRYYAIFNNDTYPDEDIVYDARAGLGLMYAFGAAPAMAGDTDGDGVPDDLDECPDTPPGMRVDARGCPLPVPVTPADSDGDGVSDAVDQCPGTPPGVAVDQLGCPLDEDGDGVPNALDACPQTPPGFKVDARGCVVEAQTVVVLKSAHFEFNSAKLTRDARIVLDRVVDAMKNQPDLRLEIVGHTDSVGTDAYNRKLSLARADSVREFLVDRGIARDRLQTAGKGKTQPIADNETEEGRAQNRRVEFSVLTD